MSEDSEVENAPLQDGEEEEEEDQAPTASWTLAYPASTPHVFSSPLPHGPTFSVNDSECHSPLFWFGKCWTAEMTHIMVTQTNLYAAQFYASIPPGNSSTARLGISS